MRYRYPKIKRMQATDPVAERQEALIYCRSVYAGMLDWYKIADAKGQLLLTLNGVFVTVLSSSLLLRPEDLSARKTQLTLIAWVFILGAAVAVGYSIFCGIMCLRSRLSNADLDKLHANFQYLDGEGRVQYRPAVTFWFGTVARFKDQKKGLDLLLKSNAEFELSALADEILLFAPNVLAKHQWVNRGWVAAGCALLFTVATATAVVASA